MQIVDSDQTLQPENEDKIRSKIFFWKKKKHFIKSCLNGAKSRNVETLYLRDDLKVISDPHHQLHTQLHRTKQYVKNYSREVDVLYVKEIAHLKDRILSS